MHVDSVEIQFRDDDVVVACAGIYSEDFELQRPFGLRAVVVAEGVHIESLERAAVLQGKCSKCSKRIAASSASRPPSVARQLCRYARMLAVPSFRFTNMTQK